MQFADWAPDFTAWTPTDWAAAGGVGTAIIALVAAIFAFRQVREARRLRVEQAQPFVVVDFEPSPIWRNIINLVVENIGKTLARNVKLSFSPRLESTQVKDKYDLNESVLLRDGIPTMPPGKRIEALFDLSHERKGSNLPMTYRVKVDFDDSRGRKQDALEYVLDLSYYYGLQEVREYGLHDAAKALREIDKTLRKWTAHFNGVRIWLRDEAAYLDEQQLEHQEQQEFVEDETEQKTFGADTTEEKPAPMPPAGDSLGDEVAP